MYPETGGVHGSLAKASTGIPGLDEITGGGLPRGRPTLVCGSAGCGKTLLAMEFLVRGASHFDEPGVFFAFEETARELTENVRSLGFDLDTLTALAQGSRDHGHHHCRARRRHLNSARARRVCVRLRDPAGSSCE